MTKLNRFASIPVILVFLLLLSFAYYVTIFVFLEQLYGLLTVEGSLNAIIFTVLELLCLLSFVISVCTDPGNVPSSYVPDVEDSGVASYQRLQQTTFWSILMVSLTLILGTLLGWHIYLITHNMTTKEILGPNMLKWFRSTSVSHLKDGTSYPTTTGKS